MQFKLGQIFVGALVFVGMGLLPEIAAAQDRPAVPGGMYDKPYIERFGRGTAVGGYIDMEWEITEDKNTFDQHRLIPFIFSEISDRIHFATEIEFEHGGRVPGDGEVKLEYAALDIQFADWLTYRSGVILSPLGKFNLVHDSPWNDFVSRPLVDRQLIPTTLSESGMGFHGTMYPSEMSVLGYEVYLVNGFNDKIISDKNFSTQGFDNDNLSTIDSIRTRKGRGSLASDNNKAKSLVGRVVYSPMLGIEIGGSVHSGVYSPDSVESRSISIGTVDATLQKGPFEVLMETAYSTTEITSNTSVNQFGYYLQPNIHFGFGLVPGFPESKFTGMVRLGRVDYNLDADGEHTNRYTFGLNWRPKEDTAVKVEYLLEQDTPLNSTDADDMVGTFFFGTTSYF